MPRKTLALISGLVLVTVVLFFVALRTSQKPQQSQTQVVPTTGVEAQVSPATPAHTVLTFSSNTVNVAPGQQGKVDVVMDPSDNAVTAVQLELQYDPAVLSNVQVTPGSLFQNPAPLINKNDAKTGRFTYAFGIFPNHEPVTQSGVVASITFTAKAVAGTQSTLTLLPYTDQEHPGTMVTARGIAESVRKDAEAPLGVTVLVGNGVGSDTTEVAPQ